MAYRPLMRTRACFDPQMGHFEVSDDRHRDGCRNAQRDAVFPPRGGEAPYSQVSYVMMLHEMALVRVPFHWRMVSQLEELARQMPSGVCVDLALGVLRHHDLDPTSTGWSCRVLARSFAYGACT